MRWRPNVGDERQGLALADGSQWWPCLELSCKWADATAADAIVTSRQMEPTPAERVLYCNRIWFFRRGAGRATDDSDESRWRS